MIEIKHTPGPWSVFKPKGKSSRGIGPSAEVIVARAMPCFYEGKHHAIANANLIAAAPDLLTVLRKCQTLLAQQSLDLYDEAVAAIAKAEGK